jgi:hypothetical protein
MIRALMVALLMSTSLPALASWTAVITSNEGDIVYVDFASIRKDGDNRTYWAMTNYKQRTPYGDMSARRKEVMNCKNETRIILQFSTFTQPNLGGAITTDFTPPVKLEHVAPRTTAETVMQAVCSK